MGNVASHDNRWYLSSSSFTGPLDPAAASLPGWLASWLASEDDNTTVLSFRTLSQIFGIGASVKSVLGAMTFYNFQR